MAATHRPLRVRLAWACCRSLEPLCCPALRGREGRWGPFPPRPSASALWTSWRQIPLLRLVGSPVTPSGPGGPSVCLSSLFTLLADFGRCFICEPGSFSRRQGTGFSAESSGLRVCEALLSLPRAPFLARSRAQCPSHPVPRLHPRPGVPSSGLWLLGQPTPGVPAYRCYSEAASFLCFLSRLFSLVLRLARYLRSCVARFPVTRSVADAQPRALLECAVL